MVARRSLDRPTYEHFQATLMAMPNDDQGRELLRQINLDGFLPPDDTQFAGIARVLDYVSARERLPT
jgi:ABC-type phosphate/phosphonate transport system substrate-binding protein